MARVTVEDCVVKVPNRFELVLLAAQRAREIASGASLTIDRDDDKNPVVALREIADDTVGLLQLRDAVVRGMQKHVEIDEPEETHELEVDAAAFTMAAPIGAHDEDEVEELEPDGEEEDLEAHEEAELDGAFAVDADEPLGEDILSEQSDLDLTENAEPDFSDDFGEEI